MMHTPLHMPSPCPELLESLSIRCEDCCGLCCAALCFAKTDGFPANKPAGIPCTYLTEDFRCSVHSRLKSCGFRGCMAYDCMGAGQKLCRHQYDGRHWRDGSVDTHAMFEAFYALYALHQMLWYLAEAASLIPAEGLTPTLHNQINRVEQATYLPAEALLTLNTAEYRRETNNLLKKAWKTVQDENEGAFPSPQRPVSTTGYMGKDLRRQTLAGRDMSMCLLIAANLSGCDLYGVNFLGADLRDTDLRGADLRESLFLTQGQLNAARGNRETKLPPHLTVPTCWNVSLR